MTEIEIMDRMTEILEEYSTLPQIEKFDLTLEAIGSDGTIKVLLSGKKQDTAERIITPQEPLYFICDTFNYPNTFTPRSRMFAKMGLKEVYFDRDGCLIVVHDDSTEKFKVTPAQRDEVTEILKDNLGNKMKA